MAKFGKRVGVSPIEAHIDAELEAAQSASEPAPSPPPAPAAPKYPSVAAMQAVFVRSFILQNRDEEKSKGLHGSFAPKIGGVRTGAPSLLSAIRTAFAVDDGVQVLKDLEAAGVIAQRPCKGGYMTYLAAEAPPARPDPASREDLLAKYLK